MREAVAWTEDAPSPACSLACRTVSDTLAGLLVSVTCPLDRKFPSPELAEENTEVGARLISDCTTPENDAVLVAAWLQGEVDDTNLTGTAEARVAAPKPAEESVATAPTLGST